jgi:hypothetical protein
LHQTGSSDRFATISTIRSTDAATWDKRVFLTFDVDWAHDRVLEDSIDLVEQAGVAATWFVTHDTPLLARLRSNPRFELGIHPNFLPLLLAGDPAKGDTAAAVLDRMLDIVPEATAVRSHSLVQSGRLLQTFRDKGLSHDANMFIPDHSAMTLRPWTDWFGIERAPFLWEDDFWCDTGRRSTIPALLQREGIISFNFHPIHVFLNSETLDRYEKARDAFHHPAELERHRNPAATGTRDMLRDLLSTARPD